MAALSLKQPYSIIRYDDETELYYLMARYYEPKDGVFLSVDPQPGEAKAPISQHSYVYVQNNPVMLDDSDGENPLVGVLVYAGGRYVVKYVAKKGIKYAAKKYKGKIPPPRKFAKSKGLRNTLNEIYRPKGKVGDGSLATSAKIEVKYGVRVGGKPHLKKTRERIRNLERLMAEGKLNKNDWRIANRERIRLKRALNGK
ncbi:RHS repeat-associated core domain-containing protein [Pseudobacillus sp. FSL P4-0506]|uniref:RHS repeat domain-containing protein n=1 Tax=Pseudobacillus sp. FSL P4-0506 TaxID=2921576 RepID=UPI0030F7665F